MGVNLEPAELDEFLEQSHTMILSTIRRSGEPFMTPLWYVYMDGCIYFSTPSKSAKVAHLERDARACVLVEEGEQWVDLKAVVLNCDAVFLDQEGEEARRFRERSQIKYQAYRPPSKKMPDATKKHYSGSTILVKLVPRAREVRSWYNQKIRGLT